MVRNAILGHTNNFSLLAHISTKTSKQSGVFGVMLDLLFLVLFHLVFHFHGHHLRHINRPHSTRGCPQEKGM